MVVTHAGQGCTHPSHTTHRCPHPQAKKKENISREMKQRLRKEYYGLGGAENTVRARCRCCRCCCCRVSPWWQPRRPAAAGSPHQHLDVPQNLSSQCLLCKQLSLGMQHFTLHPTQQPRPPPCVAPSLLCCLWPVASTRGGCWQQLAHSR